jgi:hypothetical protein
MMFRVRCLSDYIPLKDLFGAKFILKEMRKLVPAYAQIGYKGIKDKSIFVPTLKKDERFQYITEYKFAGTSTLYYIIKNSHGNCYHVIAACFELIQGEDETCFPQEQPLGSPSRTMKATHLMTRTKK